MSDRDGHSEHRAFLNRYYGISRFFYDLTRKYYLFGRDTAIRQLVTDSSWRALVEIGPGTGRNLIRLHEARPDAMLGGVEASDAMLGHARKRCPWARLEQGFAESAEVKSVLGQAPERILFSYCLSMVGDPAAALANTRRAVAPGGEVVVVDFADFAGFPPRAAEAFRAYLRAFHVSPPEVRTLEGATSVEYGPANYYLIAKFAPLA